MGQSTMRKVVDWALSKPKAMMKPHYDVVVIGSGYGGGVAASRLCRAGLSVCVLERGREIKPGDFKAGALSNLKSTQINGRKLQLGDPTSLYDFRTGDDLHVLLACGLGGGSLINSALALRPELKSLKKRDWPEEIFQGDELETGFVRAERMLGVKSYPNPFNIQKFRALEEGAQLLGCQAQVKNNAIHFEDGVNRANVAQGACTLCGDCWSGCKVGAKNTVGLTYLTDALNHGADIFTTLEVSHLEKASEREGRAQWTVRFKLNKAKTLKEKVTGFARQKNLETTDNKLEQVTAGLVVVAAGSLGSTEILLRSREKGLELSDRLGKGFSSNGDDIVLGVNQNTLVNGNACERTEKLTKKQNRLDPVGPNCMGYIRYEDDELEGGAFLIEDGAMIPAMSALAPLKALTAGKPRRAIKMLFDGPFKGLRAHTQTHYLVSHDSSDGELILKNDRLEVHWPHIHDQRLYEKYEEVMRQMVEGLGGEYKESPLSEMGGRKVTAHPLGGCGMGESSLSGVVNHKCQVFKSETGAGSDGREVHDGLYVCDGAVMPTSIGSNPLLTITAMAERAMIYLARDRALSFHDKRQQDAPLRLAVG